MPTSLCPPNTPHASFSRRSFFALAATAASYAALGPVAFESAPLDRTSQHPLSRQAWAAETRSPHNTIEGILGATRCALDELKAHEYDSYYLGTPYGNTGPDGAGGDISTWDCWHPNGKPKSNGQAYMNCTGFIVAVLEACGANCEPIGSYVGSSGYNRGNKSNLSRWISYLNDHSELRTRYESKESMLASGQLRKGDIIIADPLDWGTPGADCHILFFWGDAPNHDLAWHSSSHADGVVAGACPGNMISQITAKWGNVYWLHVPLTNLITLTLQKRSAEISVATGDEGTPFYSLEGAQFSVFQHCENGVCSGLITEFSSNAQGYAEIELAPGQGVWIREDRAPLGFCAWDEPRYMEVGQATGAQTLDDTPKTVRVAIEKRDAETGERAQGHATLSRALFELVDSQGNSYTAESAWHESEAGGAWIAEFPEIARGTVRIREISAPKGYAVTPLPHADADGWAAVDLAPESDEACATVVLTAYDRVFRGDIEGAKFFEHEGESDESLKSPLAGAEFEIWLQDDGGLADKGYSVAPILDAQGKAVVSNDGSALFGSLMGTVTTKSDGRFTSKDLLENWEPEAHGGQSAPSCALPYGTYAIVETHCPDEALRLVDPIIDIEVHADAHIAFMTIEDHRIYSPVRVKKTDAETGKTVLSPGTVVELLRQDANGEYQPVSFDVHTPSTERISRFTIPESGMVQFPERLAWGSYAIREVSTIAPYLTRKEPVYFEVAQNHRWEEDDAIEITLPNEKAYGAIEGRKIDILTGEDVSGATYEARAATDIVFPDGTLALHRGDFAGSATSNEAGAWTIAPLPLGSGTAEYIVVETLSPEGYRTETKHHHVTLTWENDTDEIVCTGITIEEEPTGIEITKVDAQTSAPIAGVEFILSAGKGEGDQEEQGKNEASSTAGIQNNGTMGNSETTIDANETKESEQLGEALRNAGESTDEAPGEANADDEAADTSDKYKLVTDEEGLAKATHLPKGRAYTLRETLPRFDLGYVTSDWSKTRFLASDGRWYESEDAWIEARNAGCEGENEGDALWKETIENDFTRLAFFKVDAERCEQAGKTHADDGSAEQAASQARIEGGRFRLEDSQGNPIEPCNDGFKAEGWAAQGETPVEFSHLRVGEAYSLVEACAPEGYKTDNQELLVEIRDTPEIEIVTLKNERIKTLPKTLDFATSLITGAAGLAFAGSAAAMAAYSKRRCEMEAAPKAEERP